ncbi:hypothetical protein PUR59_04365 [Streptomyces sp. SP18ES09]|uniref:hypothetical protein n=1 Tax=Streptomyces sp. SP18ES09 TaxID=3002532 RepID=UPI002E78E1DA|nr:hypothetical protein [Streptomyces sp. SP18ES09]MEE1814255.1 hypothetical protein [Streptomyces sp. SP18ES09]
MFTSSRRLRAANDALRAAAEKATARDARIRELESNLASAQGRTYELARGRADVDHVIQLEKQVKSLTETVSQLRSRVPDDAQTADLRRQLGLAKSANRTLEARLAELQAANSGIAPLRVIA